MFRILISAILLSFKFINQCFKSIYVHLREFYFDLDTIKDCSSLDQIELLKSKRLPQSLSYFPWIKVCVHFLPPTLAILYGILDFLYVVFFMHGGQYNSTGMPELLTHHMTPEGFWDLFDIILLVGMSQCVFTFGYLAMRPNIDPEYFMFAVWNDSTGKRTIYFRGKFWKQDKSDKILKKRARIRKVYTIAMVISILLVYLFYVGYHLYYSIRDDNLFTFRNLWLTLYYHFWSFYIVSGVVFQPLYFHLLANYIQLKQRYRLKKINLLIADTARIGQSKSGNQINLPVMRSNAWNRCLVCNRKVFALFNEVAVYNRFWSFLLTNSVLGLVMYICCFLYFVLFIEADTILENTVYIFYSIELAGIIMLVTRQCSIIVQQNVAIYRANLRFAYTFSRTLQPTSIQLLKLSKIISNYKSVRSGFRFINHSLIDSRMFEILFVAITIVFLKIVKKKLFGVDYIG